MKNPRPSTVPAVRRALAAAALVTIAALMATPHSLAEPANQKKKGTTSPDQTQRPPGEPNIVFTPWTKVCPKAQEASAKRVCFIGRDGRVDTTLAVAVVVIEPEGEPKKILRITLPLMMALPPGTRVVVDQGQPMSAPYLICFPTGCVADYEASDELIDRMRKGQNLNVQGINGQGQPLSVALPLADFAKAHDGPPSEPPKQ
jgi:invasion protein IalB